NVGSRDDDDFGAQWHGPLTRCLRFAARVTPAPRKTRFRPLARLCRAGLVTRKVPSKGFRATHASPSPKLSWRTQISPLLHRLQPATWNIWLIIQALRRSRFGLPAQYPRWGISTSPKWTVA